MMIISILLSLSVIASLIGVFLMAREQLPELIEDDGEGNNSCLRKCKRRPKGQTGRKHPKKWRKT